MGRNSGGVQGGTKLTPSDLRAASKEVTTARAALTRAETAVKREMGGYIGTDNKGAGRSVAVEKAMEKLNQAQAKYDSAQKTYEAKLKAYQSGKRYKGK